MWEAQFGDFINGAQVDHRPVHRRRRGQVGPAQRARPAAAARLRRPGPRALVGAHRALPHVGGRGQHPGRATPRRRRSTSTCCAVRCTPSVHTPLVLFTPKAGAAHEADPLAHRRAHHGLVPRRCSTTRASPTADAVASVVFCSGKVAWDAMAERDRRGAPAAVVRVEQLYPLPHRADARRAADATRTPAAGVAAGGAREHGRLEVHRAPHVAGEGARLRPAPRRPGRVAAARPPAPRRSTTKSSPTSSTRPSPPPPP